jgi:LSD1 subclass zinc finger protein
MLCCLQCCHTSASAWYDNSCFVCYLNVQFVIISHYHNFSSIDVFTGTEMAQLVCGGCHTLLMYIRGATSVQCSCCHTVNLALEGIELNCLLINSFCMCKMSMMAASKTCFFCVVILSPYFVVLRMKFVL